MKRILHSNTLVSQTWKETNIEVDVINSFQNRRRKETVELEEKRNKENDKETRNINFSEKNDFVNFGMDWKS